jgi:hypothetical protein
MTGIKLFLTRCIYSQEQNPRGYDKYVYDDENIHYAILQILLETSARFSGRFLQIDLPATPSQVTIKPEGGIFDMRVLAGSEPFYFEVKIWSLLSHDQFDRQTHFLQNVGAKGRYLLFTRAADAWSADAIAARSDHLSQLVTPMALTNALADIDTNLPPEVTELAEAYRAALEHLGKRW